MNFKSALQILCKILDDDDFTIHPKFKEELSHLLNGTLKGQESDFFNRFIKLLSQLKSQGRNIDKIDSHEKLSHYGNGRWYSLHIRTKYINFRMLITFSDDSRIFLLSCFDEKSGKKKTGYQRYIPVLKARLSELESESNE
ncbi:MAG: hypothetical protein SOH80_04415 [Eubacteriales bacterium]|jgi:hypothetical protein